MELVEQPGLSPGLERGSALQVELAGFAGLMSETSQPVNLAAEVEQLWLDCRGSRSEWNSWLSERLLLLSAASLQVWTHAPGSVHVGWPHLS